MSKKEDLIIKDKNQNVIKDERIEELMSARNQKEKLKGKTNEKLILFRKKCKNSH